MLHALSETIQKPGDDNDDSDETEGK